MTDSLSSAFPLANPNPPHPARIKLARRDLDARLAAVQNRLCPRRRPISLRAGNITLQAMFAGPANLPRGGFWLGCDINGHAARIGLSWGAARRLTGLPLEGNAAPDIALLIEEALADWLDDVEMQTGLSFRLHGGGDDLPGPLLALGLRVEFSTPESPRPQRLLLPVELSAAAGEALADVLGQWNAPRAPALPLALRLSVEIETMRLSIAELEGLRPGDALILPDLPIAGRVLAESQLVAPARPASDGSLPAAWALTARFQPRTLSPSFSHVSKNDMTDANSDLPDSTNSPFPGPESDPGPADTAPDKPAVTDSLDGLEVRISVRLGDTLMSLADLRRAGPGTIITLDRPDGAMVDLVANGQLIGTGEVIAVSGRRAIEIRSLFGDE